MSTSEPRRPARRVVTPARRTERRTAIVVPAWLMGVFTGAQAAVFTYLCVVVPTVAAFISTSASPVNEGVTWVDAARTGTDLWIWAHGGSLAMGSGDAAATISLAPLGVLLLAVWACSLLTRLSHQPTFAALLGCVGGYGLVVGLAGAIVGTGAAQLGLVRAISLGMLAAGLGAWWGARRLPGWVLPGALGDRLAAVPDWVRLALRTGSITVLSWFAAGAVLAAVWMVWGHATMGELFTSLRPDALGSIILIVAQLALIPNLAIFALSYLLGAGFDVGTGAHFSPFGHTSAPLPSLPLLGALPNAPPSLWTVALVGVPLVLAGLTGVFLLRRTRDESWGVALGAAGVSAGLACLGAAALAWLAGGSAGPGRLASVGPSPGLMGLSALLVAGIGIATVVAVGRSGLGRWISQSAASLTHRTPRRDRSDERPSGREPAEPDAVDHGPAGGEGVGEPIADHVMADGPLLGQPAAGRRIVGQPITGWSASPSAASQSATAHAAQAPVIEGQLSDQSSADIEPGKDASRES